MRAWAVAVLLLGAQPAAAAAPAEFFGIELRVGQVEDFSREQLASFLQRFVDQAHGIGFRYLGDPEDFDHGHVLYSAESGKPMPVAILYHTQEGAGKARESEPGGKYDYLDKEARNWLQWLDSERPVENAARYARRSYPDAPSWNAYRERLDVFQEAGTVASIMLDPARMGGAIVRDVQWEFARVDCAPARDISAIRLPGGELVCVRILP